jgi:hypothetical protein
MSQVLILSLSQPKEKRRRVGLGANNPTLLKKEMLGTFNRILK